MSCENKTYNKEVAWDTTYTGYGGYTSRYKIPAGKILASTGAIKLAFGRHDADWAIGECWIGHINGTYGFDGNQVQILFGGNAGITITVNGQESDEVNFNLDETKDIIIAIYITPSPGNIVAGGTTALGYAAWYKAGNDAANASPSGYTTSGVSGKQFHVEYICDTAEEALIDGSLDLSAYYRMLDDLTSFLRSIKILWGPQYHGLSLADGQAFLRVEGLDLAEYAGQDRFKLILHDSADKTVVGYISEPGAGETLGSELITNSDNEAGIATWVQSNSSQKMTVSQSDEQAHGGTYSAKCVCTESGEFYTGLRDDARSSVTVGKLYKASMWTYLPTGAGTNGVRIFANIGNGSSGYIALIGETKTTRDSWVYHEMYFTINVGSRTRFYVSGVNGTVDDYFYVDDISIKEVTAPAADGALIVSAQGGATRNWTSIESGFNYNGSSYQIEIQECGTWRDMKAFLTAYFESIADVAAFLETWGTHYDDFAAALRAVLTVYKDLPAWLAAYGQSLSSLAMVFRAGAEKRRDLAAFFCATDGIITGDFAACFVVTDGTVKTDLGLYLRVVAGIPAFRTITAQKVSSVVHEVS